MESISTARQPSRDRLSPSKRSLATVTVATGAAVMALLTIGTAGQRLHQVRVETAFVARSVEPIAATDWGTLTEVYVREGETVRVGDPLVRVERDLEIQTEIARLETLIQAQQREQSRLKTQQIALERERQQAQVTLATATTAIQLERQQIPARTAIARSQVASARGEQDALAQRLAIAHTRQQRFESLLSEGAISQIAFDDVVAEVARLQGAWQVATENLDVARTVLGGTGRGDFIDRDRLQGELPKLQLQQSSSRDRLASITDQLQSQAALIAAIERDLTALRDRQQNLRDRQNLDAELATTYTAPVAGAIAKIPLSQGNSVSRGASLVVLQHDETSPQIAAYLTLNQAQQLAINGTANVFDPTTGHEYPATVTEIDWTGGRVDGIVDPLTPSPPTDRAGIPLPVLVQLAIRHPNLKLPNGSPVVVTLEKHRDLFDRTARAFRLRNRV
ncbi:MAG: HlyD family efflux transporter periplasmic adaptor subunit [Cyanobacteria bacterium J06642_2]